MSAMLPGLAPPACLRLGASVWGVDTSTVRMAVAGLLAPTMPADGWVDDMERAPRLVWDTLSLPRNTNLAARQAAAYRVLVPWLAGLGEKWGRPDVIGYEAPLAGGNTPLPSFYVVGVLLAAVGEVFGIAVSAEPWSPGEWKKVSTGEGYVRGLPKAMPKAEKRRLEKARLLRWARDVAGYTGDLEDEADAVGVVTATGIRVEARRRG